jgi:tRNA pseudouridine38-40 synthase
MPRFKLTLEYEGTRYRGWQRQKNARSVQGELDEAIIATCNTRIFDLTGSGRTDAGVHALMQVAHLDVATAIPPHVLHLKLNDLLPADINILALDHSQPRFHARHHAEARRYVYQVSRRRTAFGKRFVWWVRDPINIDGVRACLQEFTGMHDFRQFSDADPDEASTMVLVQEADVAEHGDLIVFRFRASHFIWKMVRRLVGASIGVGRGTLPLEAVRRMMKGGVESAAQFTAPPSGLFLEGVFYKDELIVDSPIVPVIAVLPVQTSGISLRSKPSKR